MDSILNGSLDLNFSVIASENLPGCLENQHRFYIAIDKTSCLIPITNDFDLSSIEESFLRWLLESNSERGVVFTSKSVIQKLKKLGWHKDSHAGSHAHFCHSDRKGKVTVPIHNGTIPKGTLKSILNQAGIDFNQFQMA